MAYYLIQAAYAADAWAALVKKPQNRVEAIRPAVEKLGGRIEGAWFCFGDYDIVLICRMPDNLSAAAFSVAAAAGGALRALKTTPLLTTEEGLEVMKKAGGVGAPVVPLGKGEGSTLRFGPSAAAAWFIASGLVASSHLPVSRR